MSDWVAEFLDVCFSLNDVHFTPETRNVHCKSSCPLWANSGLMQRSKKRSLFDHLIGAGEQRRRHREAECLGSFEVDHQLILSWRLHWQLSRLLTLQHATNLVGCQSKLFGDIGAITHQTGISGKIAEGIDGG